MRPDLCRFGLVVSEVETGNQTKENNMAEFEITKRTLLRGVAAGSAAAGLSFAWPTA